MSSHATDLSVYAKSFFFFFFWRRSHAHCRRWRLRRGHAPGTQTEPQVEPATAAGVISPETGQFLLLCSLQLWQQLQCCRQTRASFLTHFTSVLRKQFAGNDTFFYGSEQLQASARVKKLAADVRKSTIIRPDIAAVRLYTGRPAPRQAKPSRARVSFSDAIQLRLTTRVCSIPLDSYKVYDEHEWGRSADHGG